MKRITISTLASVAALVAANPAAQAAILDAPQHSEIGLSKKSGDVVVANSGNSNSNSGSNSDNSNSNSNSNSGNSNSNSNSGRRIKR